MMMKVAHQVWMISMTMEVRKKKKLELSLMMLHAFLNAFFNISIRVLELKKGAKELNSLAHLKKQILNIKNRSKWSVVTVLHFSKDFSCLSQPLERVESVLVRSSCRSTLCKKRQST
jgi:hypothetical protein